MDMGTRPYALAREEGRALWFLGTLLIVKATGEQTGGAFGLIDNVLPAGFASPYHVHRNEDESFYVVEGEMAFYVGDERVKAGPGAFVYGPRGVPPRVRGGGGRSRRGYSCKTTRRASRGFPWRWASRPRSWSCRRLSHPTWRGSWRWPPGTASTSWDRCPATRKVPGANPRRLRSRSNRLASPPGAGEGRQGHGSYPYSRP